MDKQNLLEYLIASGPVLVFRRTTADLVTFVSPNVERLLGYRPEDVVGAPGFWNARIHPDDTERFQAEARGAFANHATELFREYRFRHADGSYRWLQARTQIEYDAAGVAVALTGYAFDATDERTLERQSEQLFSFPLALLFVAGMDGYFKRVSAGYERLLGWTEEELLARPFAAFVHPDDLPALGAAIESFAAGGREVINQEIRALHKDGTYRWLNGNYMPDPEHGLMYGVAVDMTQRKQAEEALVESERRTRLIIDTAYEAFIAIDADGRILEWNAEAERIFGWGRDEIVGRQLVDMIIPERYRADHNRGLERHRATGEGPVLGRRLQLEGLRRDGTEFPVELTISPLPIDHGFVFNAFLRDITERIEAETALREAGEAAEESRKEADVANRAKTDFLARMSHELRTPLNAIIGFTQLLQLEELPPTQVELVEQVLRAGRHLLTLIEELLDIARIEQGRLSLSVEPVLVGEVVGQALELVTPLATSSGVTVRSELRGEEGHVFADQQRLKQVLMNLLSNGVKYNQKGGQVTIRAHTMDPGPTRIEVADTGPGIPTEQMDRLFLPFERLGAQHTSVEGTGIGLSISKHLTELMGGRIGADSEVGRGSTFWIELEPSYDAVSTEAVPSGERVPEQGVASEARTILYVEDNLSNLQFVERIIQRRPGTKLIAAMQGGLALDLARQHAPDMILLDVHLPDMEGDEVLEQLRRDVSTREIPVVVVSAEASTAKIERFHAAGAHAYLTKPLDVRGFLETIDGILGRPQGSTS
jgi:PAS domain S-box-containing protein